MIVTRKREDNYDHVFQLLDEDNAPIPVTTETFELTIDTRENPDDISTQLLNVSGSIVDGPSGTISFSIDGTQPVGNHFFDVQMIDLAGNRRTIEKGNWNVVQDINKNLTH